MTNIIPFPSNAARSWAETERWLRDIAVRAGVGEDVGLALATRIKPLFDLLSAPVQVSVTLPEACASLLEAQEEVFGLALQERNNRILMERIYREVEAYKRHGIGM